MHSLMSVTSPRKEAKRRELVGWEYMAILLGSVLVITGQFSQVCGTFSEDPQGQNNFQNNTTLSAFFTVMRFVLKMQKQW